MAKLTCGSCKQKTEFHEDTDIWECPRCRFEQPTGFEKRIRKEIESIRDKISYPKMTVGRAVGLAAAIYELSTHNDRIDIGSVENRLEKKYGVSTGFEKSSIKMMSSRSYGALVDNRVGMMIYVMSGRMEGREWNTAFVVFRGSRGSEGGTTDNPQSAGWDDSTGVAHNLDWAANFTTDQVPAPWFPSVKIHKGFLEIYSSVGENIRSEILKLRGQLRNLQVVCTGHSLGAGLATVCAHDLEHTCVGVNPFCYPFCSPKTGNLAFARNYDLNIGSKMTVLECEPGRKVYCRGITFVQSTDPVSWGGDHGFKNVRMNKIHAIADSGSTLKQGLYAAKKTKSKTVIYYLAPNVYRVSVLGFHSYMKMESELLGTRPKRN